MMPRKEIILMLATKKLSQFGYTGFSYADLAKDIGIAKASLHYHFASKEILVINICDAIEQFWQQKFDDIMVNSATNPALDQMTEFIQSNLAQLKQNKICALAALLTNYESLPEPLQDRVYELVLFEYSLYTKFIQKAIDEGDLNASIDRDLCVTEIISMIKGSLIYRRIGREAGQKFNDSNKLLSNLYSAWRKL